MEIRFASMQGMLSTVLQHSKAKMSAKSYQIVGLVFSALAALSLALLVVYKKRLWSAVKLPLDSNLGKTDILKLITDVVAPILTPDVPSSKDKVPSNIAPVQSDLAPPVSVSLEVSTRTDSQGNIRKGTFNENGELHGKDCTVHYTSGKLSKGEFGNGRIVHGIIYVPLMEIKGDKIVYYPEIIKYIYDGKFKDDKLVYGKYIYDIEKDYFDFGDFVDEKIVKGSRRSADYTYTGEFEDNDYHGRGEMISHDGKIFCDGTWIKGKFIHGEITVRLHNGLKNIFKGDFNPEGNLDGQGTFTDEHGVVYTGTFENNIMIIGTKINLDGSSEPVELFAIPRQMSISVSKAADDDSSVAADDQLDDDTDNNSDVD